MKHISRKPAASSRTPSRYTGFSKRPSAKSSWVEIDPSVVFEDLLPDLAHGNNSFAWACCVFHDDNNPSLCVNVESGWYKCMSSNCGATGSNIVGFVSRLLGYEYAEARDYLEQHYG